MSNGQYIWNYFMDKIGNAYGVAGMMGNIYAESGYYSNNMENEFEGTYDDESYTRAVNNGSYTCTDPNGIYRDNTRDAFTYDEIGYGICQWTWNTRKRALYDMYKTGYTSISSIKLQCDYLWYELQNDYSGVLSVLKSASSIREASDKFLHDFENPQYATNQEATRAGYGQTAYDDFSGNYTPMNYEPRLSGGDLFSNKWYIAPLNPFAASGYGLPNCTCYAWGRRGEITGEAPDTSLGSGYSWWDYNKKNNVYPSGQTPKLGAICCWSYGTNVDGHVAIVEQINEDGSIVTSNSGWISAEAVGTTEGFYTQTLYPEKNYCWDRANGGTLIFQGFIYLPDDFEFNPEDPEDPDANTKKKNLSKFLLYAGALDLF